MQNKSATPVIALYDYGHVFFWPSEDSQEPRDQFLNWLHNSKTCPFCRVQMTLDPGLSEKAMPSDYVVICNQCGFWFGRGTKDYDHDGDLGAEGGRGALGLLIKEPLGSLSVTLPEVLRFLNENPKYLSSVDPFRAEELVCRLLHDAYGWEVRHIGGRKDKGIDALAIISDAGKVIVQVKWRSNNKKAESVTLVREFAGTLLARGIPNGIIVTTRDRFSSAADMGIAEVSKRSVVNMGRLNVDYKTYSDLLSMLEISCRKITEQPRVPVRPKGDHYYIFDGNGIWDNEHNYIARSKEYGERPEWTDPFRLTIDTSTNNG